MQAISKGYIYNLYLDLYLDYHKHVSNVLQLFPYDIFGKCQGHEKFECRNNVDIIILSFFD